jgi:DNA (cytosine-5)-methyltransferase 1
MEEIFTVAEYFAGIGLVRMGLEPAGWQVTFSNDFSEKKHEMYATFFPDEANHYVIDDIFHLEPQNIPPTTLATCSFPCIDLSLAGNMNGIKGKHSSAFWGFIKILEAQKENAPPMVLVENVPGWLYSNKGADFRVTVQALNKLGYSCDVFTLNAQSFTPQSRLRVFLVGIKTDKKPNALDTLLARPTSLATNRLKNSVFANRQLSWYPLNIPTPPRLKDGSLAEIVEEMAENDPRWWAKPEVDRHFAMMDLSHRARVMQLVNQDVVTYRTFFRRRRATAQRAEVRHDDIAGCLRTAVGGSGKQFLLQLGHGSIKMRTMTPREYARLQGVPDHFPIKANGVQALTGFGDAVCVPAITWIAQHILNPAVEEHISPIAQSMPI